MSKIYGLYRFRYSQLKDRQSMSFYLNKDLEDYVAAGIFAVHDMQLGDEQYTRELAPGLKSLTRFFRAEYNEQYVPQSYVDMIKTWMLNNHYAEFFDTIEAARLRIRSNTTLQEDENIAGKFLVRAEVVEEGLESPALYLIID